MRRFNETYSVTRTSYVRAHLLFSDTQRTNPEHTQKRKRKSTNKRKGTKTKKRKDDPPLNQKSVTVSIYVYIIERVWFMLQ